MVTITTPEWVSTESSEYVTVQLVVNSPAARLRGKTEVEVYQEPAEFVPTITTPECVSTELSELVVAQEVVTVPAS